MHSANAFAAAMKLPLGLQLYSVRDLLPKDYDGTLKELGAIGYREVEAAGYYNHPAAEVKAAMEKAGLKLVSAHYSLDDLNKKLDTILPFHHELGVEYIICSYPGFKDPSRLSKIAPEDRMYARTLDDWKWNADQFNVLGEKVAAAGMKFGYHNHHLEFKETEGKVPLVELIRNTDPAKVTIEMDCGWVWVGGGDPVEYLRNFPKRISMLHVKDFQKKEPGKAEPKIAELGQGAIDYRPIFAEAEKGGNIRHIFVEQEGFTIPWKDSLKVDADYMRKLGVA
jgi:sugar phosphate isomerase/epimerase